MTVSPYLFLAGTERCLIAIRSGVMRHGLPMVDETLSGLFEVELFGNSPQIGRHSLQIKPVTTCTICPDAAFPTASARKCAYSQSK